MHRVLGVAKGARLSCTGRLFVVCGAGPSWTGIGALFDRLSYAVWRLMCGAAALSVVHAISDIASTLLGSPTHAPGLDLSIATYQPMISTALAPNDRR